MVRTALVTGAASGLGKACAVRLARDGAEVGVFDLNLEKCEQVVAEIKAAGGKAVALQADVTKRAQVAAAAAKLREAFGPITIVVNSAGITGFVPFDQLTDELWDRMYEVNVKGTFIVTQTVVPDMKAAKWGRIINISSSSAQTGAVPMSHYSSSKGAIISFTRSLAQELGPMGITVNNIPPGSVRTPMFEANEHLGAMTSEALMKFVPVRRIGVPEDIANACAFLASEDSSYITGQTLGVNGGRVVS